MLSVDVIGRLRGEAARTREKKHTGLLLEVVEGGVFGELLFFDH